MLEHPTPRFPTLARALEEVARACPGNGFVFQDDHGEETRLSYPDIERVTARRAAALQARGLKKGDRIGLIVVEPQEFVLTFLAAVRVGVVPVPLYPPLALGALDAYGDRSSAILEAAGARVLVASSRLQNVLWALVDRVESLETLVPVERLADGGDPRYPEITPDDLAFLQFTSGSTATPKGVMVTHRSLMANAHAMIVDGVKKDLGDGTLVSWLPLYHDMGLVGFVLAAVANGLNSVLIPTMRFIRRPSAWFETIHRHRATMSCAPNFGYELITRRSKDEDVERWDLSCLEVLCCGAEPIHPETIRRFHERFTPCGLKPTVFMPAYGMAEATLAISFKPSGEVYRTRKVDAASFEDGGRVQAPVEGQRTLEHVSCGRTFPGHEVRAFNEDGPLPDGVEGELRLRGPSVTAGYFQAPEATAETFRDGWLHTGDLGFVLDGQVYITGRLKDLIIVNGRNIHPQAVEWVVQDVEGVRKGNVVAFSVPGQTGEELVVALESRRQDLDALTAEVREVVQRELSLAVADVAVLPPGTLPKTSSGKLQRRKTRQHYRDARLGREGSRAFGSQADALTLARHVARSVWTRARSRLF